MLVQTYTKEKPTSVLQHLAGEWNFDLVPLIVYTSFALVSNALCLVFVASCLPLFLLFCLLSWSHLLPLCFCIHTSTDTTPRVIPETGRKDHQALSSVTQPLSCSSKYSLPLMRS